MSGHSKWHKVRQKKGATDAKRAASFTRLSKAVTMAAREGGGDPDMNFRLRIAIDKAKEGNLPKDNIDRAIKRGTGEGGEAALEEVVYEGYGPGGIGMLIVCLTDNTNRTVAEVKHLLSKHGASMAGQGSVMWMFDRKGVITIEDAAKVGNRDEFELALIDVGAEDIRNDEDGLEIITDPTDLKKVVEAINGLGITTGSADLTYLPKEPQVVSEADQEKLQTIYEVLDENDDVSDVITNEK